MAGTGGTSTTNISGNSSGNGLHVITSHTRLLFVSGPMTGLPELNHDAFHAATRSLRAHGYYVISPAELCTRKRSVVDSLHKCARRDLQALLTFPIDGLATLPDGPEIHPDFPPSKGMAIEYKIATECLHIPVRPVNEWLSCHPVTGERFELTKLIS